MNVREAKDFLVQKTAEQAALQDVPLSDLERRMMYFTETGECPEDPVALNDAFEAGCKTQQYETKVAKLMAHAYRQLKKDNPSAVQTWDEAIKLLRKGDHYILVLWDLRTAVERPPYDTLKLLGSALLVIIVLLVLIFGWHAFADQFRWNPGPTVNGSIPHWLGRLLLAILVGVYLYYGILPLILRKPLPSISPLILRLLRAKPINYRTTDESDPKP
jgi:hypothetical protein